MGIKRILPGIYFGLFAIGILLILFAAKYAQTDIVETARQETAETVEPTEVKYLSDTTREFIFSERNTDDTESCLAFFTNHQNISVYADGELIYSVTAGQTVFGRTTGSRWNYVDIPYGTTELVVCLEALEEKSRNYNMTFYLGNGIQMYEKLVRSSALEVIISLLDIVVGILLIAYWLIMCRKDEGTRSILYFGIFAACIGVWSFDETELAALLIQNSQWASFTTYMMLLFVMVPFVLFVKEFLAVKETYWSPAYCIVTYIYMIAAVVLHMTGIVSFKNSVTGTHILMAIAIAYLAGAVVQHWKHAGFDQMVKANLCGGLILLTALSMDIIAFYLGLQKTDVIGRIGLLVYICLLGWEVTNTTLQQINEGRKAALYKELAMKDMLTGLYNRNAYNHWVDEHEKQEHTVLVTFDLNNLKKCNDTLGHMAGDQYISGAAEIIRNTFGKAGETFRIGGDEFCTILQNAKESDIPAYLMKMRELEQVYNQKNELVTMRIACGYAVFDAEQDRNLEDTRSRADARMYRNKKELKNA